MKRINQLTQLIWDFWREDKQELKELKTLAECQVSRWWGILHIHCLATESARKIVVAEPLIERPLKELRLANQVKIWVNKNLFAVFKVNDRNRHNDKRGISN